MCSPHPLLICQHAGSHGVTLPNLSELLGSLCPERAHFAPELRFCFALMMPLCLTSSGNPAQEPKRTLAVDRRGMAQTDAG